MISTPSVGSLTDTAELSFTNDLTLKAGQETDIYFRFRPEMTILADETVVLKLPGFSGSD